ncbi:MAG: Gfo/Idh/MocA family oxidoreductase [Armatimonadetes bacterium]|nr:Gfo/Idh/MocA family oxidoreductase [Armatimonadota bacterium]
MSKTISGAVIGYGPSFDMGKHHATWMEGAGIQFVAVCDVDEGRCTAAKTDFPTIDTYLDYSDLLARSDIDLIVVVLPHNLHAEVTVASLQAGKNVIVEKPMCLSVAEADEMIGAATTAGKMLSVFHNRRHDGDYLAIKKAIDDGLIGDVFHIECSFGNFERPGDGWRSDKSLSGGNLFDWGAHFLDWILNFVPGPVDSVTGFFKSDVWKEATNEDHTQAILRFANGCVADLQVSSLSSVPKPKWRILGTKGGITADWGKTITVKADHEGHIASFDIPCAADDWAAYYENIVAYLRGDEPLNVTAEQSRRTIAIIEAAEKSSRTGQAEKPAHER